MTLIFWQGIISIHQKAFLEALAKQPSVSKVLLAVEHEITPYRENMGWEVPVIEQVEIIRAPSMEVIEHIFLDHKDAVHIIGGIRVGKMLTAAFDLCIKHKCKLGVMTEPYNDTGLKGKLRAIKYQYYRIKYFKDIQFVLAIGKQAVKQYTELGFDPGFIFPWAYFISINVVNINVRARAETQRIIYAGRLEEGKGIYKFIMELINAGNKNYKLDIYGAGPDEEKMKHIIAANGLSEKISIFPFLKYADLLRKYQEYDWVVLPSTQKDGWGVIVSEGLLNGLKAICSNICGASGVIKDGYNGVKFDWSEDGSSGKAIGKMLNESTFGTSGSISKWAKEAISGDAGAIYFLRIIDCVYRKKVSLDVPWILN